MRQIADSEQADEREEELFTLSLELEQYVDTLADGVVSASEDLSQWQEALEAPTQDFAARVEDQLFSRADTLSQEIEDELRSTMDQILSRVEDELLAISEKLVEQAETKAEKTKQTIDDLTDSLTHQANLLSQQAEEMLQKHFRPNSVAKANQNDCSAAPVTINTIAGDGSGNILIGSPFGDQINGGGGNDLIIGLGDGDVLNGGNGSDFILGGNGDDFIHGNGGSDFMLGMNDSDCIWGDAGLDFGLGGNDQDDLYGGNGTDFLFGMRDNDDLFGNSGFDVLLGGDAEDEIHGDAGTDIILGQDGADTLHGDAGLDILLGGAGNDVMRGNAGTDLMWGEDDQDEMYGDDGIDYMRGGNDDDEMYGNDGVDVPITSSFTIHVGNLMFGDNGEDNMYGGKGIDLMLGNDDDDDMHGGKQVDIMFGMDGDDEMRGNHGGVIAEISGVDVRFGNLMFGNVGEDLMYGGADMDVMLGQDDNDEMYGGDGTFVLLSLDNDIMSGGAGADEMYGLIGPDWMDGGEGPDEMHGGLGSDKMLGRQAADEMFGNLGVDFMFGGQQSDQMDGGWGPDLMVGNDGEDIMQGNLGIDVMLGMGGVDTMDGGLGKDIMSGGAGNDIMQGDDGSFWAFFSSDWMLGGPGIDSMNGGQGKDIMFGGLDDDTMNGGRRADWMFGGRGGDTMHGNQGWDRMFGGRDADTMHGDDGWDTMLGGRGNDDMHGHDGWDLMFGGRDHDLIWGDNGKDILFGNRGDDEMHGGDAGDIMSGNRDNDCMWGDAGNDWMDGNRGNDCMWGGSGWDTMSGGRDDDKLWGGSGTDFMSGNHGNDQMEAESGADLVRGGRGNDRLSGGSENDFVFGGRDDDCVNGDAGNDFLTGGRGDDCMSGDDGRDWMFGNRGNDVMLGGNDRDRMWGNRHDDILDGNAGNDRLRGGWGDDTLWGGPGTDNLAGGFGSDTLSANGNSGLECNCLFVACFLDYGDAPDSYGTLLSNNGAYHGLGGPVLGTLIDAEADGQPGAGANLDDANNVADEDGVVFSSLAIGATATATVELTGATTAALDAWIDFNQDGLFTGPGEQIFTSYLLNSGSNSLALAVPLSALSGTTYARFRVSAQGGLSPDGYGDLGEVEDYQIEILDGLDFGDAPDSFGTTLLANGARHTLGGPVLGSAIDAEPNGQPSVGAYLDNTTGSNDEDGVVLSSLVSGSTATATITLGTAGPAYLSGWIDFEQDGDFTGAGEQIFAGIPLTTPISNLSFAVSTTALAGVSYARFRIGDKVIASPLGYGGAGEVEDYRLAIQPGLDFGDAPDSYGTLLGNNGARHSVGGPILGVLIDTETDGQPSVGAYLDNATGSNDEDGVVLSSVVSGSLATATIALGTPGPAYLSGWIDFEQDGDFTGVGEQIFAGIPLAAPTSILSFPVPSGAIAGASHARFRIGDQIISSPLGDGGPGEVEDYRLEIQPGLDFGDAPDSYGTTLINNGASHSLGGPMLGTSLDPESDGQPSAGADGDDSSFIDDEDGVTLSSLVAGLWTTADVELDAGTSNAVLDAWVDFNQNGSFLDPGEQIFSATPIVSGSNTLTFAVSPLALTGSTYARFRVSDTGIASPVGYGGLGEVEDYAVMVAANNYDFGDAPESYGTLLASGAFHAENGPILGSKFDTEPNGQPSLGADGDDSSFIDDEDGVTGSLSLVAGGNLDVILTWTGDAVLDAWVDFNQNGSFLDLGEQVFTSEIISPGNNALTFAVPPGTLLGETYARFRVSETGVSLPTGYGGIGEVEDYLMVVKQQIVVGDEEKAATMTNATKQAAVRKESPLSKERTIQDENLPQTEVFLDPMPAKTPTSQHASAPLNTDDSRFFRRWLSTDPQEQLLFEQINKFYTTELGFTGLGISVNQRDTSDWQAVTPEAVAASITFLSAVDEFVSSLKPQQIYSILALTQPDWLHELWSTYTTLEGESLRNALGDELNAGILGEQRS